MSKTKVVTILAFCMLTLAGCASQAADSQVPPPKEAKWILACSSDNNCVFLSDGKGNGDYPNKVKLDTLTIQVEDENKCVWQWKLIAGVWRWVCVKN